MTSLCAHNQAVHDALEELWTRAMEALTALDLATASAAWDTFVAALAHHAALEDATMLPIYAAHGVYPRGAALDILTQEHAKLDRLAADGRAALTQVTDRRSMIALLPRIQRVHQVLEHHTLREQTLIYPTLDQRVTASEEAAIVEALRASMPDLIVAVSTPSS